MGATWVTHTKNFGWHPFSGCDCILGADPSSLSLNIWTAKRVNLVLGKVDEEITDNYAKEKDTELHYVLYETPGADIALTMITLDQDRKRSKHTMTRLMTTEPIDTFKCVLELS